jgi:L-arabinose isomerase
MTRPFADYDAFELWFLTGSQSLYGDETLQQVAAQSQQVVGTPQRSREVPVRVKWRPVLTDAESIRRTMLDANANDRVIGVIAWMHTFSPAKMWIAGLKTLSKPLSSAFARCWATR